MTVDNPDSPTVNNTPFTETALETSDEVHPEAHKQGADQKKWSATPLVNVDDSRN